MKTAIFVYKSTQVSELEALIERTKGEEYDVIACGADIEFLLEKKNIRHVSARGFLTVHPYDRLLLSRQLSEACMHAEIFSFFSHQNIGIARMFTQTVFDYLPSFLYNLDIAISALESGYDKAILFSPGTVEESPTAAVLETQKTWSFPNAVAHVCEKRKIPLDIVEPRRVSGGQTDLVRRLTFFLKRALFDVVIWALNLYVRLFVPKKDIRVIGSELWKNISPLMEYLPETEFILLDRVESLKIGLKAILKNRMQFVHAQQYLTSSMRREARIKGKELMDEWEKREGQHVALAQASLRGYSLAPILRVVLRKIVSTGEKTILNIEGANEMMKQINPDVVVVRASSSAQIHFAVLCEVARHRGVPSLEIQHGIFSTGPETETSDRTAEYIAEYGPIEAKVWKERNYAPRSKFIDVGSPRFDEYIEKSDIYHPAQDGVTRILHIAPAWVTGLWNDTWDICYYFQVLADAVRDIPKVHITIKLRATRAGEEFFRESINRAFGSIPYTIAIFESLSDLIPKSDMVVSCHSTVVLEGLLSHRPVILDGTLPMYTRLVRNDFTPHKESGALIVVEMPVELKNAVEKLARSSDERQKIVARADQFMEENYLFHDAKSAERLAGAIRMLSKKS